MNLVPRELSAVDPEQFRIRRPVTPRQAAVFADYWKVADAVKFWMAANWHVVSSVSLAMQVVVLTTVPPQVTNVEPVLAEAVRVTELPLRYLPVQVPD